MAEAERSTATPQSSPRAGLGEIPLSSHRPQEGADLALFAEALAARLPGSWTAVTHDHTANPLAFPLSGRVWDNGHLSRAYARTILRQDAVLTSDRGSELVVVDRPRRRHEFLVATLAPRGINVTDAVEAPDGVVVSADPARAASTVADRLIPRYAQAVHQARIEHLAVALAAGEHVLAEWDAVSNSLCDADHWPLDDRYGLRQQQRDSEMWAQFAPFLDYGPALLAHAEETLPLLDPTGPDAGRWRYRLRVLSDTLDAGAQVEANLQFVADALVPDHPGAKEVFDRAIAERNAEGWDCALTWMDNAGALVDLARAEQRLGRSPKGLKQSAQAGTARARSPLASRKSAAATKESAPRRGDLPGYDRRPRSR
ncbi:hypothetical protein ACFU7T_34985 [Streptomyces sp. NPDC057555]|uniref:hypothetical protein n=1 Tax=Streptomyces sp. NPDC057555 TaxID=3346166 RepID=UPI0036C846C9